MQWLTLSILMALLPGQANVEKGEIRGKVTRAISGDPVSDVQILLVGPLKGPAANAVVSNPLMLSEIAEGSGTPQMGSVTQSDGNFSFRDLPPGDYMIRGQRDGYFSATAANSSGLRSVAIASMTVMSGVSVDINLKMIKSAVVSGRVLNSEGKSVAKLPVNAYQISYGNGREMLESVGRAVSDDRGQYRIFSLPPGNYYVGAGLASSTRLSPFQLAINGNETCCTMFFPGVPNARNATMLSVTEGAELADKDIDLNRLTTFKLSGQLMSMPSGIASPQASSNFSLQSRDTNALMSGLDLTFPSTFKPDGSFEIQNVPPGSYNLSGILTDANSEVFTGLIPIEVGARDLDDVRLPIHPASEVRVRILLDGNLQPSQTSVNVQLVSVDLPVTFVDSVGGNGRVVDSTGAFVISKIRDGHYSVRVGGLPANSFISDIRQSGASIYDEGLVINASSAEPVDVLLSTGAQSIRGKVQDSTGKPAASATVVLVPPAARRQNAQLYRTVRVDRVGEFSLNNVPPGEYKVFAWEYVPNTAYMNAAFMEKYESRGRSITVAPGLAPNTVDVTLIPVEQGR